MFKDIMRRVFPNWQKSKKKLKAAETEIKDKETAEWPPVIRKDTKSPGPSKAKKKHLRKLQRKAQQIQRKAA